MPPAVPDLVGFCQRDTNAVADLGQKLRVAVADVLFSFFCKLYFARLVRTGKLIYFRPFQY